MFLRKTLAPAAAGARAARRRPRPRPRRARRGAGGRPGRGRGLPRLARRQPGGRQRQGHGGGQGLPRAVPDRPVRRLHQEVARHGPDDRARRRDQGEADRGHDRGRPRDPRRRPREPERRSTRWPSTSAATSCWRRRPSSTTPPAAVEFAKKAIALVEAGKTLDRRRDLRQERHPRLADPDPRRQREKNGNAEEAIKLYEKSTALAPDDPAIAARNLLARRRRCGRRSTARPPRPTTRCRRRTGRRPSRSPR